MLKDPDGVPWGWGKIGMTLPTSIMNKLKQQAQLISGRGKYYILSKPSPRRSNEMASAKVIWLLSIGLCHLLSVDLKADCLLWKPSKASLRPRKFLWTPVWYSSHLQVMYIKYLYLPMNGLSKSSYGIQL